MRKERKIMDTTRIENFFRERSGKDITAVPSGMYHLAYEGQWQCVFVNESCLEMLGVSREDFLTILCSSVVFHGEKEEETLVGSILRELALAPGERFYTGVARHGSGQTRRIKSTLTSFKGQDGRMQLYGQVVDITHPYEELSFYHSLMKGYQHALEANGKTVYSYVIKDRRAILPPVVAKRANIPEVIDNLPEWNVKKGRIAPESIDQWYALFDDIHQGKKHGARDVEFLLRDGTLRRRSHVEFISVSDSEGVPHSALITYEDVTDQYERDRNYSLERSGLLQISRMSFPEILSVNLTNGTYRMIQYYGATMLGTPEEGPLDQMLGLRLINVAPEDQQAFRDAFFHEGLMESIRQGKKMIQLAYRRTGQDGKWHWMETTAIRQENPYDDDVLVMAVSRSIDREKEQEEMLRQALESTSEQLEDWLYYNKISSNAFPGLVYVGYEDERPSPYVAGTLAQRLRCFPAELALGLGSRIHPDDKGMVKLAMEEARQSGAESFRAEYRVEDGEGGYVRIANHAVAFADEDGHKGYVHYLTDTTYEFELAEKVRRHMEDQVKETEQVFRIVAQHSNRTLYKYDIRSRKTSSWGDENQGEDILAHLYTDSYSADRVEGNKGVLPESISDVKRFFKNIHGGEPTGEENIHIQVPDGQRRWYHFRYSSLFEGDQPTIALISVEDVTEQHEREVAYQRHVQSLEFDADGYLMHIESDLTADRIEKLAGKMLSEEERAVQCAHSDFGRLMLDLKFGFVEREEASNYFSCENLLGLYENGIHSQRVEWQVRFADGTDHWLETSTMLMADPYNGHIKAFFRMTDITKEREERMAVMQRADYDAMTGLLRRGVGEERIRQHLALNDEKGGILIALDLDDLKGINDSLGHTSGDAAIIGIANTLKSHFRKDDILIRAGGDEFWSYLPGAGHGVSSVQLSMAALLRKLSSIAIDEEESRYIHCSAGCAVVQPGSDTFETLFKRADLALYHVKRRGKNNFAFFVPGMLREDYEFKVTQAFPVTNAVAKEKELEYLLKVIATQFPGIIYLNLTRNYYQTLSVGSNVDRSPPPGKIHEFWQNVKEGVHPDDVAVLQKALSRDELLSQYGQGQRRLSCFYRNREEVGYVRTELLTHLFTTTEGDICAFLFFHWDPAPEKEREVLRLQKILELSVKEDFEYICLINVRNKSYSTFSREGGNFHSIPEEADFDMVTKHIRDTQIPPEQKEAYYQNAALDHVLERMAGQADTYQYRYATMDGTVREAAFHWYENSRSELLMTVRRVEQV